MPLAGKNAIVTGGTGGLGRVIVGRFVEEGINVAISFRHADELARLPDSVRKKIDAFEADVTLEHDVRMLFERAAAKFANVDILVNTVGGFLPRKPITDITVAEWDHMMNSNLRSTFLCSREALRRMQQQNYGRIINISAMVGLNPSPGRSAYAISKSAVSILTSIVAQEHKGSGITINAIAPSIIDTEANRQSMPEGDFKRWVKPENIADTICYLCLDGARDVTGTTIKAFGGL